MTVIPRVLAAVFAAALSILILWTHHTTAGLIAACVFALTAIYAADPGVVDGLRKELSAAWSNYKNPQSPEAKP